MYQVEGEEVSWHYKSVDFTKNHQLTIYKKGSVPEKLAEVVANVWNWDPKWKVEWLEDGKLKGAIIQYVSLDPQAVELYADQEIPKYHKWVEPVTTDHLF